MCLQIAQLSTMPTSVKTEVICLDCGCIYARFFAPTSVTDRDLARGAREETIDDIKAFVSSEFSWRVGGYLVKRCQHCFLTSSPFCAYNPVAWRQRKRSL